VSSGLSGVRWSRHQIAAATLVAVAVAGALALLLVIYGALVSLFVGVLVASAVQPLVARLERRMRRTTAALLVHVAIVALAAGFAVLLLPLLIDQVRALWSSLPGLYASLHRQMVESGSASLQRIAVALPAAIDPAAGGASLGSLSLALAGLGRLGSALLTAAAIIALSYAWSVSGERTVRALLMLLPLDRRAEAGELVAAATATLAAFVRGQLLLCAAVGVLAFIAYTIIGLPHAVALAVMAGVLEAVPMIGPALGAVPAALVGLTVDPMMALWVGVSTIVIQTAENYVMVPRVMDRTVGVNPIVTILAITAFGALLGVAGALLAIPLAALAQLLLQRFVLGGAGGAPSAPEGRDQTSALRYEAQELAGDIRQIMRNKDGRADDTIDALEYELEAIAVDLDRLLARSESAPRQAAGGQP
jgi:predicted PurR-regulated permease PerM